MARKKKNELMDGGSLQRKIRADSAHNARTCSTHTRARAHAHVKAMILEQQLVHIRAVLDRTWRVADGGRAVATSLVIGAVIGIISIVVIVPEPPSRDVVNASRHGRFQRRSQRRAEVVSASVSTRSSGAQRRKQHAMRRRHIRTGQRDVFCPVFDSPVRGTRRHSFGGPARR